MNTQEIRLVKPAAKIRLGVAKYNRVKRTQDLIEAIGFATVIFVIASFLIDGGLAKITDVPSALGALSRLTALVATDLLLIQMILVARVPWLDRLYGHDRTTIAHKKLGKPVLYIVIAHFLASLIQYAMQDGKNIFAEIFVMANLTTDLLLSFIALAAMIIVVITSIKIARAKLSYEAWYLVHLLSYVAVLAAVPHEFSVGQDVAGKPLQSAFWIALYVFVGGNLVWFRFLQPIVKMLQHRFTVTQVHPSSSDTASIYIGGKNMHDLTAKAGQFYLLRIMTAKQWWRPHPFSLSAAPNEDYVRFTVGDRGDDTSLMQNLKVGTRVMLEGPYGVFTEDRRTKEKVTLICAGIGVPPIRALAESMVAKPGDITIIYRTRDNDDAALLHELDAISQVRGHELRVLEGPRANPKSWLPAGHGNIPDYQRLRLIAPSVTESDVFICGPVAWTRTVEKSLHQLGMSPKQIHAEEFAW
jgi:predicted ferric reductase